MGAAPSKGSGRRVGPPPRRYLPPQPKPPVNRDMVRFTAPEDATYYMIWEPNGRIIPSLSPHPDYKILPNPLPPLPWGPPVSVSPRPVSIRTQVPAGKYEIEWLPYQRFKLTRIGDYVGSSVRRY